MDRNKFLYIIIFLALAIAGFYAGKYFAPQSEVEIVDLRTASSGNIETGALPEDFPKELIIERTEVGVSSNNNSLQTAILLSKDEVEDIVNKYKLALEKNSWTIQNLSSSGEVASIKAVNELTNRLLEINIVNIPEDNNEITLTLWK